MTFEQIKQIYPHAFLDEKKEDSNEYVIFPYQNKWIHIKKEPFSKEEHLLLELLIKEVEKPDSVNTLKHSEWQAFLSGENNQPPAGENLVRVIQIELRKKDDEFDEQLWLESISNLFDPIIDIFFLSEELCLVIQNEKGRYLLSDEMEGILQTLDDDFSTQTYCYVGQYWNPQNNFPAIYKEERDIFKREQKRSGKIILTLSNVALRYYTEEAVSKSSIMQELKAYISSQPEWEELIFALWESRGNVSMAAKSMFVHRNTLQYRIDRFQDSTGLSLRDMNDLIICYMLIV